MKTVLALILSAAAPLYANAGTVDIRLYSLYKFTSISMEPGDGAVLLGAHKLESSRISAHGSAVLLDGPVKAGPSKALTITAKDGVWLYGNGLPRRLYTGQITFSSQKGRLRVINAAPLEEYLSGVVSGEAADLAQPEAYKAQSVASRTYTMKHSKSHSGEGYNLCDSTHCQLYTGLGSTRAKARAAVKATTGEILLYEGLPAETYYHSACGGRTESLSYVWPYEDKPYLTSVRDGPPGRPYCSIAPRFRWKTKIYFTGLTRLARQVGWITSAENALDMKVTAWGKSGRAATLEIRTQQRRVNVSATDFYHGIGRRAGWNAVRSSRFTLIRGKDYVMLDGFGSGHGVGMCQWGSEGMARKGFNYKDILRHYYPGTELGHD